MQTIRMAAMMCSRRGICADAIAITVKHTISFASFTKVFTGIDTFQTNLLCLFIISFPVTIQAFAYPAFPLTVGAGMDSFISSRSCSTIRRRAVR